MKNQHPTPDSVARTWRAMQLPISDAQADALARYLGLLLKWNKKMNLVGPRDWETMLRDLCTDSFHLGEFLCALQLPAPLRTLDLGAGAGLPGVPLRMFWNDGEYELVEVREKRAIFMQMALAELKLPRTKVVNGTAEDALAASPQPGLVLSRAFKPWRDVLALVHPWLAEQGVVVTMANEPPPDVIPEGWRLLQSTEYTVRKKTSFFWALALR